MNFHKSLYAEMGKFWGVQICGCTRQGLKVMPCLPVSVWVGDTLWPWLVAFLGEGHSEIETFFGLCHGPLYCGLPQVLGLHYSRLPFFPCDHIHSRKPVVFGLMASCLFLVVMCSSVNDDDDDNPCGQF